MSKDKKMETARTWLRLARGEGDANTKREYLAAKGFSSEELEELMRWEREDARNAEVPLFE
jgi:hypothetical protein